MTAPRPTGRAASEVARVSERGALEVLQPRPKRAVEGGLHRFGLRGDRVAQPRSPPFTCGPSTNKPVGSSSAPPNRVRCSGGRQPVSISLRPLRRSTRRVASFGAGPTQRRIQREGAAIRIQVAHTSLGLSVIAAPVSARSGSPSSMFWAKSAARAAVNSVASSVSAALFGSRGRSPSPVCRPARVPPDGW